MNGSKGQKTKDGGDPKYSNQSRLVSRMDVILVATRQMSACGGAQDEKESKKKIVQAKGIACEGEIKSCWEIIAHCGHRIDHHTAPFTAVGWRLRRGHMHDAKREKNARQDAAAFSHEREMQQLARRGPVGVTAVSHMT